MTVSRAVFAAQLFILSGPFGCIHGCFAADGQQRVPPKSKGFSPAQLLLEESRAYPIEVRAYVFEGLDSHLPKQGRDARMFELDGLFRAAPNAQAQFPVRSIRVSTDDVSTYEEKISSLGVDTLSIQLNVVKLVEAVDPGAAVSLFQELRYPDLPQLSCASSTVPDVTEYFRMLANVYKNASIGAKARRRLDDVISLRLARMTMLDAAAAAALLADLDSGPARALWLASFTSRLQGLYTDDRSAQFALTRYGLATYVGRLAELSFARAEPPIALVTAYRNLLLSVYLGERCQDTVAFEQHLPAHSPLAPLSMFNDLLPAAGLSDRIGPLPETIPAARVAQPALSATLFWQTAPEKQLLALAQQLQESADGTERVLSLLTALNQSFEEASAEDRIRLFHEKAVVYMLLLGATQDRSTLEAAKSDLVSFLTYENAARVPYAHWLWEVDRFFDLGRTLTREDEQWSSAFEKMFNTPYPRIRVPDPQTMVALMSASREPILSLVGRLEQQYPRDARGWK